MVRENVSVDIKYEKSQLRGIIKELISVMSNEDRVLESKLLYDRLKKILPSDPVTICAYMPMEDEIDIKTLLKNLLENKYSIYLPKYEDRNIKFYKVEDLSDLVPGSFDIPEPASGASELCKNDVSYVLIPGRAFDRLGNRLGRGHGGYDKWIRNHRAKNQNTTFLGVCYGCQIVQKVPVEAHDEPVDSIVSARGL